MHYLECYHALPGDPNPSVAPEIKKDAWFIYQYALLCLALCGMPTSASTVVEQIIE
jgi:hypothetical protein